MKSSSPGQLTAVASMEEFAKANGQILLPVIQVVGPTAAHALRVPVAAVHHLLRVWRRCRRSLGDPCDAKQSRSAKTSNPAPCLIFMALLLPVSRAHTSPFVPCADRVFVLRK